MIRLRTTALTSFEQSALDHEGYLHAELIKETSLKYYLHVPALETDMTLFKIECFDVEEID